MGRFLAIALLLLGLGGCGPEVGKTGTEADGQGITVALGEASAPMAVPLPAVAGSTDPERPLVVIDPGHGGRDPGAVSPHGGHFEKDVALAIARTIHDELAASGRVRVALTRNDDRHLEHQDRFEIARRLGAKLFISVHADAAQREGARGATVYTLSEVASDREAALLAARENASASVGATVPSDSQAVNQILVDLAQRESMAVSARFAQLLHREASPLFPFQEDYHRFAALAVLKAPDLPSVLFESGYLTNPADTAYLRSLAGQRQIARGVRKAVETHFARRNATLAMR